MTMTIKAAKQYGVVTKGNSKIHGSTFSTDPKRCNVGQQLVKIKGSTCESCYALKLAKVYPSAAKSWADNLDLFRNAVNTDTVPEWCEAIALQINAISKNKLKREQSGAMYHRWFTAGDLDSMEMLTAFIKVANLLPHIKFWLPTREKALVARFKNALGVIPSNMIIRLSSAMVDGQPVNMTDNTSTTHGKGKEHFGFACPAQRQGGSCGDCSQCWNKKVKNVSYAIH